MIDSLEENKMANASYQYSERGYATISLEALLQHSFTIICDGKFK